MDSSIDEIRKIRGLILEYQLEVEQALEELLSYIIIPDHNNYNRLTLLSDILTELTFNKKIRLLKKYKYAFDKDIENYPNIFKDLNEVREIRNNIAHMQSDNYFFDDEPFIDVNGTLFNHFENDCSEYVFYRISGKEFRIKNEEIENYKLICKNIIYLFELIKVSILSK